MPTTTALLFPGQGSHSEGMHEPFADHPLITRGIELLGFDPFDSLAEGTRTQQPALFLCSMAQWASRGDRRSRSVRRGRSLARRVRGPDGRRRDRLRGRRAARARSRAGDGGCRGAHPRRHGRDARRRARRDLRARSRARAVARQRQRSRSDRPLGSDDGHRRRCRARRRDRLPRPQARCGRRLPLAADGTCRGRAQAGARRDACPGTRLPRPLQRQHAPVRGHPHASSPRTSSSRSAGARSSSSCRAWARPTTSSAGRARSCAAS